MALGPSCCPAALACQVPRRSGFLSQQLSLGPLRWGQALSGWPPVPGPFPCEERWEVPAPLRTAPSWRHPPHGVPRRPACPPDCHSWLPPAITQMNGISRAGERTFSQYRKAIRAVGVSSCCSAYVKFGMCIWDLMRIFMCSQLTFTDCSFPASQVLSGWIRSDASRGTGSKGAVPPLGSPPLRVHGPPENKDDTPWSPAPRCHSLGKSTFCSRPPGLELLHCLPHG